MAYRRSAERLATEISQPLGYDPKLALECEKNSDLLVAPYN
jgi:hypothetical protein